MAEKIEKQVRGYKVEADTDMTGHGFRKELFWRDLLSKEDGRWYVTTYHFTIGKFPCHLCKTSDYTWLVPQRTGIYKVCLGCQTTTGPVTMDDGTKMEEPKEITPEEARDILVARQMKLPEMLVVQLRQRSSRIKKGKPRGDLETF